MSDPSVWETIQISSSMGHYLPLSDSNEKVEGVKSSSIERIELRGNPNIGEVIFIRQLHDIPEFSKEFKVLAGKYQCLILKELTDRKIKHIFVESLSEDSLPNDPVRNNTIGPLGAIKAIFPNGVPSNPTDLQIEMLTDFGASLIYAYLNPGVTLHKTYTKEESQKIDATINKTGVWNNRDLVFTKREELAVQEINAFLKHNPGTKVALVYGALHEFKDDFIKQGASSPILVSITLPNLFEEFASSLIKSSLKKYFGRRKNLGPPH